MNSKIPNAARQLAAYLVGQAPSREEMDSACRTLNDSAPDVLASFRQDMYGEPEPATIPCGAFRANVAEFCDLSNRERQLEMPDLVLHAMRCEACRQSLRSTRSARMWRTAMVATTQQVRTTIRELTTTFLFVVDRITGKLSWNQESELFFGRGCPIVAPAMGGGADIVEEPSAETEPEPALRKEWSVVDDETGIVSRFRGRLRPGSHMTILEIEVFDAQTAKIPHAQVLVEVVNTATGATYASCPLDVFDEAPLELGLGKWSIALRCDSPSDTRRWKFHFELKPSSKTRE